MNLEKLCCIYADDRHLALILLEYLKLKKTKKYKIITFFQDESKLKKELESLVKKSHYDIGDINKIDFTPVRNICDKKIENEKYMMFLIKGDIAYIKKANTYILNSIDQNSKVKTISCYDVISEEHLIKHVFRELNKNDKILYTFGEKIID